MKTDTIKVKKPGQSEGDESEGKSTVCQQALLPQQRVLGGAEVGMRTELEGITGRRTDCREEN